MKLTSIFAGLALAFVATTAYAGAGEVPENERRTFVFSGEDCQVDCIEGASAILTLEFNNFGDFAIGGPVFFGSSDLLNFQFFSDSPFFNGFDFVNDGEFFASGFLSGEQNEFASVLIEGQAFVDVELNGGAQPTDDEVEQELISFQFRSTQLESDDIGVTPGDGGWSMCIIEGDTCNIDDIGLTGTWSPAPEPGAIALLGVGLFGLAAMRRRRRLSA